VSLLLEALKKAERSRHDPGSQTAGDSTRNELELADQGSGKTSYAEAAMEGAGNAEAQRARDSADNLFVAKQPTTGSRRVVLGALIALLVATAAGGTYVWYQISRPTRMDVATAPRMPIQSAPQTTPAPENTPATQTTPPPVAAPAPAPAAAENRSPASTRGAPVPASTASISSPPREPPAREVAPAPPPRAARGARPEAAARVAPQAVTIKRTQRVPQLDPDIAAGYEALQAGDFASARDRYTRALARDPQNRDALMGLAAAAAKGGNSQEALRLYQRMLELDPRDPVANAALVALRPRGDPALAESRIKILISQHPESAVLNFALGNHLAARARWAEAQQAYFRALSLDPTNADYAFNNAVSLDNLGKRKLAEEYYGRALALASGGPSTFDRAQASQRLQEIAQTR